MRISASGPRPMPTFPESGSGYVASRPSPITTRQSRPLGPMPARERFGVLPVVSTIVAAGSASVVTESRSPGYVTCRLHAHEHRGRDELGRARVDADRAERT